MNEADGKVCLIFYLEVRYGNYKGKDEKHEKGRLAEISDRGYWWL